MSWEAVIGLETHAQLSTKAKIFSGASTAFGAAPNTHASAVDIALPGVLPVLNKGAVERAIKFGLAVGATINRRSVFARKNYFYPDLPKGYQISQYEIPVVQGGALTIATKAGSKAVRLTRAHLEEDAGKSLHAHAGRQLSLRRQRLRSQGRRHAARYPLRDQEPEQFSLSPARYRIRNSPPDRTDRRRRQGRAGDPAL
jgi:Asp-tRNA(Asn)/Glu-tRNA(Gln) amidotransferase B subunit